jgi:hypothetical protein
MKGRPRHVAKRHEVGEKLYGRTKQQQHTVIDMGNWSLKILEGVDPNHPQLIPIRMRNILGRNLRTPIEHHDNLGITEQEIPRKLLIVCTVSVHYFELEIVREELQRLVQYKPVEDTGS